MRRSFWVALSIGACTVAACSSVPDVRYSDQDGGGDGGKPDAPVDSGVDAIKYSCPGSPPPGAICCNTKICEGCATTDCTECAAASCGTNDVCCPVGGSGKIVCKTSSCR